MQGMPSARMRLAALALAALGLARSPLAGAAASATLDWTSLSETVTSNATGAVDNSSGAFGFLGSASSAYDTAIAVTSGTTASPVGGINRDWSGTGFPGGSLTTVGGDTRTTFTQGSSQAFAGSGALGASVVDAGSSFAASGDVQRNQDFTLAAGDSVTFSINYSMSLDAGTAANNAATLAQLSATDLGFTVSNGFPSSSFALASSTGYQATSGTLELVFTNDTTSAVTAAFNAEVNVSAVPEPSSFALMLAGLASLGLIVRRRQA